MKFARELPRKRFAFQQKDVTQMAVVRKVVMIVLMDFVSQGEGANGRQTVKIMNSKEE